MLGDWTDSVTAAHIFARMHGQDTMDAIFRKTTEAELYSPKNGLLIATRIERFLTQGSW
jgi:hypothetical protein